MKVIISTHRDVLLDVQGTNIVRVYLAQTMNTSIMIIRFSHFLFAVVWSTSSGDFLSEFYFLYTFNDPLFCFCRHLIAQQYLGVLLATSFMLLVVDMGYVLYSCPNCKKPFHLKPLSRSFHSQYL